jgi:hypothetical protein
MRQAAICRDERLYSNSNAWKSVHNGTARFKKCKQLFEYQHLLLLRDIWQSTLESIFKCSSFFQHQREIDICGSIKLWFSCIGVKYALFYWGKSASSFCRQVANVIRPFTVVSYAFL